MCIKCFKQILDSSMSSLHHTPTPNFLCHNFPRFLLRSLNPSNPGTPPIQTYFHKLRPSLNVSAASSSDAQIRSWPELSPANTYSHNQTTISLNCASFGSATRRWTIFDIYSSPKAKGATFRAIN